MEVAMRSLLLTLLVVLFSFPAVANAHGGHVGSCTGIPGFVAKTGWQLSSNRDAAIMPSGGLDLEFCLGRFQYAHFAPTRLALEFVIIPSTDPISRHGIIDWGGGVRYQIPIMEIADAGAYARYTFGTPEEVGLTERHTLIVGGLLEIRPFYSSHQDHNPFAGGFNLQARFGYGVELIPVLEDLERFEIFFLAAYRFAGF
jgi:hypothetical protein